jgi:glucose/arabinose dehydrogenase
MLRAFSWRSALLAAALVVLLLSGHAVRTIAGRESSVRRVMLPLVEGGPPSIMLEEVAAGFNLVSAIASAGDERLFVIERTGRILILMPDGSVLPTPFLDIHSRVESQDREQGLLGMAFHPDYVRNGLFYVYYTARGDAPATAPIRISRFRVDPANPNHAESNSEIVVLSFGGTNRIHNGGALAFDPEGYLVIGVGDGANGGRAQDGASFFGKLLRLDVNVPSGETYRIPPSNPYRADPAIRDEIWALGFRNPWRVSFDQVTGAAVVGEVGNHTWEEINLLPRGWNGGNFGWPCYEGTTPGPGGEGCAPSPSVIAPVVAYSHDEGDCAVVGGYVYRGHAHPQLAGSYFFADFCSGAVWGARSSSQALWATWPAATLPGMVWTTFGQDAAGELYLAGLGETGVIYRLMPAQ